MKRGRFLVLIIVAAVGWTVLMSVDWRAVGDAAADDGSTAAITYFDYDQTNFDEVTVYLSVEDNNGETIEALDGGDFSVVEDDVHVSLVDFVPGGEQPVTAVMIIDQSGSMDSDSKLENAQDAALSFLDSLQNGRDRLGVVAFDDETTSLLRLRLLTAAGRNRLKSDINGLRADGGTAYYDAVYEAVTMLRDAQGRKVVLALTDGKDQHSGRDADDVVEYAQGYNVVLYTIGLGRDVERAVLRTMADETGGVYYEEPTGAELADLYTDLARSLQDEYALTYRSPTPYLDGTTRYIQVEIGLPAGTLVTEGSYAVGGTLALAPTLWPALGIVPLLFMLLLPGIRDRAWGRGRLAEDVAAPAMDVVSSRPAKGVTAIQPAIKKPTEVAGVDTCLQCGATLRPQARFCPGCGAAALSQPAAPELTCKECGASLRQGARFCGRCGTPVQRFDAGPSCPHCNASIRPNAAFCPNCGQRID